MITIEQCRAARGLLNWTQQDLANASGLSKTAINNFEKKHSDIKTESLKAIRMAFESVDIEFLENDGIKRKTEKTETLKGENAFTDLMDDILSTLTQKDEELLIISASETAALHASPQKLFGQLETLKNRKIDCRALCQSGQTSLFAATKSCRFIEPGAEQLITPCYIYGSKVAIEMWNQSMIVIIDSQDASDAERRRFEILWNQCAPNLQAQNAKKRAASN